MERADELFSMVSRVGIPANSGTLNGIVTADGVVCARGSTGDFDFLIPELSEANVAESRVGSVRVISGGSYRIDVGSSTQTGTFLRLSLASERADLLRAFVFTIASVLPREIPIADSLSLRSRLTEILQLLQSEPQPTPEAIKGLWAELWLIRASPEPSRAVRGWHGRPTDKIDFEIDGRLLEVKCHEGRERRHSLRLDQLLLEPDRTFIVSVCVAASPGGESISDLMLSIVPRINQAESERLTSQVLSVIGAEVDLLSDYKFSVWPEVPPVAVPSAFIPRPLVDDSSISQVSFLVDLSWTADHYGAPLTSMLGSPQPRPS